MSESKTGTSDVDSIESEEVADIVRNEPMFFVLSQFLETPDGEHNIASLLKEVVDQLKQLNTTLSNNATKSAST